MSVILEHKIGSGTEHAHCPRRARSIGRLVRGEGITIERVHEPLEFVFRALADRRSCIVFSPRELCTYTHTIMKWVEVSTTRPQLFCLP